MEVLNDIIRFIFARKKYWLAPVIIILLLIAWLMVFSEASALSTFIYTLF